MGNPVSSTQDFSPGPPGSPAHVVPGPGPLPEPYARIQLTDFIGRGGMGEVWMAQSPDHPGVPVVIKFLTHSRWRENPGLLDQFRDEAQAGIGISSSFIVSTLQFLDLRGDPSGRWPPAGLVMHRHEPSLAQAIDDLKQTGKRIPQALAVRWARNLLEALEKLHEPHCNLVHRDIKPSNVLLRRESDAPLLAPSSGRHAPRYYGTDPPAELQGAEALLSDLGMVCRKGREPFFHLRDDGYKAPELFLDPECDDPEPNRDHRPDPSEDMYAFGLVLMELAGVVEGSPDWLARVANKLRARKRLIVTLSCSV